MLLDFVFMFGIGIQEFGLILVVALLVFGPKRLPELARTLGRGMGEFRAPATICVRASRSTIFKTTCAGISIPRAR